MIRTIIDEHTINRLRAFINGVQRIVITCHKSPDGDALGSSLALCHVLRRLGKDAVVVTPDMAPKALEFIPGLRELIVFTKHELRARRVLSEAQLLFCLFASQDLAPPEGLTGKSSTYCFWIIIFHNK